MDIMQSGAVEVKLTRGLVTIIDAEDFELVSQHKWRRKKFRNTHYACSTINDNFILMHRLILQPPEGIMVDHRNRNGLDNRLSNLRIATHSQNAANSRKHQTDNLTSDYKGVYWEAFGTRKKRWRALIRVNGTRIHLGSFLHEEQAARAYDQAARQHFGEFARPNFTERRQT